MTRKDATAVTYADQVRRPAAVFAWTKHNLAASARFGSMGCSLGTMATLGPVLWYGLGPMMDYQMVVGGSAFWDVNAACQRTQPYAVGHCDTDVRQCQGDADCVGGPADHCRFPTDPTTAQFSGIINYLYRVAGDLSQACLTTRPVSPMSNPAFDTSSFSTTTVDWAQGHLIHFVTDEDGPNWSPSHPADQYVMEGSAMYVNRQLAAADAGVAWSDFDGHYHGDSCGKDPALTPWTAATIISEMGL